MAFTTGDRHGLAANINITPLIDVLLVLIIIFMIIQPAPDATGEKAVIPQPPEGEQQSPPPIRTIILQLTLGGDGSTQVRINGEPVAWKDLEARLRYIYAQRAERVAFVSADPDLAFEPVAQAIGIAHLAGVEHVGLMPAPRI
jgi:biopolymer transport protein TolR